MLGECCQGCGSHARAEFRLQYGVGACRATAQYPFREIDELKACLGKYVVDQFRLLQGVLQGAGGMHSNFADVGIDG